MAFGLTPTILHPRVRTGLHIEHPSIFRSRLGVKRVNRSNGAAWNCSAASNKAVKKAALWTGWATYVGFAFFSTLPPGNNVFNVTGEFKLAYDLSLNFWFIMPMIAPQSAPVLNPTLEGIFNFTVIFGSGLLLGFLSDGGKHQRVKIAPFIAATAFLTNVFYIMYLALRQENTVPPTQEEQNTRLMRAAESPFLPLTMFIIGVGSILWALYGRPDGGFGDISERIQSLQTVITSGRLEWTFALDSALFALLQGALVPDDMARRNYDDNVTKIIATIVPFFGIVYYFFKRPPLPKGKQ